MFAVGKSVIPLIIIRKIQTIMHFFFQKTTFRYNSRESFKGKNSFFGLYMLIIFNSNFSLVGQHKILIYFIQKFSLYPRKKVYPRKCIQCKKVYPRNFGTLLSRGAQRHFPLDVSGVQFK